MGHRTLRPIKEIDILVMWSGGIDSTYTLAKLLKETDLKILAHHIFLKNCENRHLSEQYAVQKLGEKLRAIRPFSYTWNMIDDSYLPTIPYDMARVCFEAGAVSKAFYHARDPKFIKKWTIGTHKAEGHWQERWDVISSATRSAEWSPGRTDFIEFELQPMATKEEEMKYLDGLGLLEDCWYCRTPKEGKPCESCKTCMEVKNALNKELVSN